MVAFQSENPITGVHIVVTHLNSLMPALRRFLIIEKQWNSFGTDKKFPWKQVFLYKRVVLASSYCISKVRRGN